MKSHIPLIALIFVAFLSSCAQRAKFNNKQEPLLDSYQLPSNLQYVPPKAETKDVEVEPKDVEVKPKIPSKRIGKRSYRGKVTKKISREQERSK